MFVLQVKQKSIQLWVCFYCSAYIVFTLFSVALFCCAACVSSLETVSISVGRISAPCDLCCPRPSGERSHRDFSILRLHMCKSQLFTVCELHWGGLNRVAYVQFYLILSGSCVPVAQAGFVLRCSRCSWLPTANGPQSSCSLWRTSWWQIPLSNCKWSYCNYLWK